MLVGPGVSSPSMPRSITGSGDSDVRQVLTHLAMDRQLAVSTRGSPSPAPRRASHGIGRFLLSRKEWVALSHGTISRHIICSGQLFAQFFRGHPEELPEAQRGQLQAQQAVRRLILSVPGPELV